MSRNVCWNRLGRSGRALWLVPLLCLGVLGGCEPDGQDEGASPGVMEGEGSSETNTNAEGVFGAAIPPGLLSEVIITPRARGAGGACGDGTLDDGESCDPGLHVCCRADCEGAAEAGTSCRAAADACDVEETCDGSAFDCPADAVADPTTECRAASDDCDVAESCDGEGKACPEDRVALSDAVCRPAAEGRLCDAVELCDGESKSCKKLLHRILPVWETPASTFPYVRKSPAALGHGALNYSTVPGCGFTRTSGIGTATTTDPDASMTAALQKTPDWVDSMLTTPELISRTLRLVAA